MKFVLFTGHRDLAETPWWSTVVDAAGGAPILICRKVRPTGTAYAFRSLRRNLRKHGLVFLPYRLAYALAGLAGRFGARPPRPPAPEAKLEEITALDIHSPEVLTRVAEWGPDLGISIGAPILKRSLFGIPRLGTINLHCGKLPDYRGAPPGFWELVTGATEVGATVHWIDDGLDTGPTIHQATAPIYERDSLHDVESRAFELGGVVLRRALEDIAVGGGAGATQPGGGKTYRQPTVGQRGRLAVRLWGRRLRRFVRHPTSLVRNVVATSWLWIVRPVRDFLRTVRARHPVRVFTYHRVTNLCRDGMTIRPDELRNQVAYLTRHHRVVTLDEGIRLIASGARLRRPVVVLTFDDGYRSVFDHGRPILDAHGVPGCCFVSTGLVGTDLRFPHDAGNPVEPCLEVMSWPQLQALLAADWSVGGHTHMHARLSECDAPRVREELETPLSELRQHLALEAPAMAYPFGGPRDITDEARAAVRACGYTAMFSDLGGENLPGRDLFELNRIELGGDHDPVAWKCRAHGFDVGKLRARLDRRTS